jgi:hypothetical protein
VVRLTPPVKATFSCVPCFPMVLRIARTYELVSAAYLVTCESVVPNSYWIAVSRLK